MLLKVSEEQHTKVKKLIPLCCNYDEGTCLLLEDICPLMRSAKSINCNYFISSVLPADKELCREIKEKGEKSDERFKWNKNHRY